VIKPGDKVPKRGESTLVHSLCIHPCLHTYTCDAPRYPGVPLSRRFADSTPARSPIHPDTGVESNTATRTNIRGHQLGPRCAIPFVRTLEPRPALASGGLCVDRPVESERRLNILGSTYRTLGGPGTTADQQPASIHLLAV
jgi:hypothetical protein